MYQTIKSSTQRKKKAKKGHLKRQKGAQFMNHAAC